MKVCIIYDSITGNTKKLAETIKEKFSKDIVEKELADIIFIGSWTDKGNPSEKIQKELLNIKNKKYFILEHADLEEMKNISHYYLVEQENLLMKATK